MTNNSFFHGKVPVGTSVQFFPGGNRAAPAIAGIVVESGDGGQVKLNLARPGGGEMVSSREYVRHLNDPWVRENQNMLRMSLHGVERGAWDFVPELTMETVPVNGDAIEKVTENAVERRTNGETRVKHLLSEGMAIGDILPRVRPFGLKRADVERIASESTAGAAK